MLARGRWRSAQERTVDTAELCGGGRGLGGSENGSTSEAVICCRGDRAAAGAQPYVENSPTTFRFPTRPSNSSRAAARSLRNPAVAAAFPAPVPRALAAPPRALTPLRTLALLPSAESAACTPRAPGRGDRLPEPAALRASDPRRGVLGTSGQREVSASEASPHSALSLGSSWWVLGAASRASAFGWAFLVAARKSCAATSS